MNLQWILLLFCWQAKQKTILLIKQNQSLTLYYMYSKCCLAVLNKKKKEIGIMVRRELLL